MFFTCPSSNVNHALPPSLVLSPESYPSTMLALELSPSPMLAPGLFPSPMLTPSYVRVPSSGRCLSPTLILASSNDVFALKHAST
ncbi:hypothetical protein Tco_0835977 [Tanacetum coccineum]